MHPCLDSDLRKSPSLQAQAGRSPTCQTFCGSPIGRAGESSELVTFSEGLAEVSGWDAEDRSELAHHVGQLRKPQAVIRFSRRDRVLPRLAALDHDYHWEPGYRGGGFEHPQASHDKLLPVRWPAGWTVLEAIARGLDIRVAPSTAGRAAAAFLRHVRSWPGLEILLLPEVQDTLYRLGERAGMTWFRGKLAEIGRSIAGDDKERLARLEHKIDEIAIRPTDHDQHTTNFSSLVSLLGRDVATALLSWAERHGVVLRGVDVQCEHCSARAWRAMGELAPPMICRGCGRPMHHPFGPAQMTFRYRGAETLLRVLEHDALVHLYAMRYLARLFEGSHGRPGLIYGMHPGVDFFDSSGRCIGEADVVAILHDGSLVIGECKRHGAGLNADEISKLDTLAKRLRSPWTFVATTDAAEDCPAIWAESQRSLPNAPRFCLSATQLFEPSVFWQAGTNPLAWSGIDPEALSERQAAYRRQLPRLSSGLPEPEGTTSSSSPRGTDVPMRPKSRHHSLPGSHPRDHSIDRCPVTTSRFARRQVLSIAQTATPGDGRAAGCCIHCR